MIATVKHWADIMVRPKNDECHVQKNDQLAGSFTQRFMQIKSSDRIKDIYVSYSRGDSCRVVPLTGKLMAFPETKHFGRSESSAVRKDYGKLGLSRTGNDR